MNTKDIQDYKVIIDDRLNNIYPSGPILLKEPINYIVKGGKRIRPVLCILVCKALGGKFEKVISTAVSIELLHIFSLVHDDIMDNDRLRHGQETIHFKWNTPIGILAGDAILSLAFKHLKDSSNIIKEKFNGALIAVCEGQALDIEFESLSKVKMADYLNMIHLKTAYMLGLSSELGAIISGADSEISEMFKNFGLLVGKAFQLQDDLLEIISTQDRMGKTLMSDIILNKKTYLMIKAEEKFPGQLREIYLNNNNNNPKINKEIRNLIINSSIVEDCKKDIDLTYEQISQYLIDLDVKNSNLHSFINKVRNRIS